jgi:hypothetical protein
MNIWIKFTEFPRLNLIAVSRAANYFCCQVQPQIEHFLNCRLVKLLMCQSKFVYFCPFSVKSRVTVCRYTMQSRGHKVKKSPIE